MQAALEERLGLLCQLAANECDPQKLIELVREINKLVEEKRKRLIGAQITRLFSADSPS
jgi:hypothetical protein